MRQVNSFRKELSIAVLIFALPFASYLHLFVEYYPTNSSLQILSKKWFGIEIGIFTYYILQWISYSLLFLTWWNTLKTIYKGFVLLFVWCCFAHIEFLFFDIPNFTFTFAFAFFLTISAWLITLLYPKRRLDYFHFKDFLSSKYGFPILLFISTFIQYIYLFYPSGTSSLSFLFIELEANYFQDAATNLFMITYKVSMLLGVLLWFFTEKKWYRFALLSSIIILTNQLYNMLWIEGDVLDEFELSESGVFLFSVLLGLILISHAAHNQAKIRSFMFNRYKDIEESVANRFKTKQHFIDTKQKEFGEGKTNIEKLSRIKRQLEKAIGE